MKQSKFTLTKILTTLCLCPFLMSFIASSAFATNPWIGGVGNWNVAGNWTNGVPNDTEDVKIITEGDICTVNTNVPAMNSYKIAIARDATLVIDEGGYLKSGKELKPGDASASSSGSDIGYLILQGGQLDNTGKIEVGYKTGGDGRFTISGGSLTGAGGRLFVGGANQAGAIGKVTIQGSAAAISQQDLYVGASDSTGTNPGDGTLEFQIDSAGVSPIGLSGTAYLDPAGAGSTAALVLSLTAAPPSGQDILLISGTVTGTFDTVNGAPAPEGTLVVLNFGGKFYSYTLTYVSSVSLKWVSVSDIKWQQLPDPTGFDVAWGDVWSLGDDWQCSATGPVKDIHFWVSFNGGYGDPNDILNFNIEIWSNNPGDPDIPWSYPDQLLWMYVHPSFTWRYVDTDWQGWFDPYSYSWWTSDHLGCWQIDIENIPDPFIQHEGEIYWLVINDVVTTSGISLGWKESNEHFMDNAAWWNGYYPAYWNELYDPNNQEPMDLAFAITTKEESEIKWQQLPDPDATGYHAHDGLHIADDWLCEGGLVTDLHWWGNNEDDTQNNWGFDISIYADAGGQPDVMSGPLWMVSAPLGPGPGEIHRTDSGLVAPWGGTVWYYEYDLIDPFPQLVGQIYWLDLSAISEDPMWSPMWHWQGNYDPIILAYPVQWDFYGYMSQLDFNMAFEITSGGQEPIEPKPLIEHSKWSQPPIEIYPDPCNIEPPVYCGWDELSHRKQIEPELWQLIADDFRCLGTMPVTSVHWWGSYSGWEYFGTEPNMLPIGWKICFWSNEPVGASNFSYPLELLWQVDVDASRVDIEEVGRDYYPDYPPDICYQYTLQLEPEEWFRQGDFDYLTMDSVFWISIAAVYDPGQEFPLYPWGWKTRPWHWMDDAVRFFVDSPLEPGLVLNPGYNYIEPLEDYYGESVDLSYELDTDPCYIKWEQHYTGIRDWPHYEDVPSWAEMWDVPYHLVAAADDWPCNSPLPVTALAWWGSYLGYTYTPCQEPVAPPEPPAYFQISIWTDVPDPDPGDPMTYSHPGQMIWQYNAYDYDEVLVGYDKHPFGAPPGTPHEPVFRYSVRLPEEEWFWQTEDEAVYWLMIVAVYEYHYPQYEWGWTLHQHVYNDDAVQGWPLIDFPDMWEWYEIYDQTGQSADLSFILYTEPEAAPPEIDFGDAPDPTYPTLLASNGASHIIGGPWIGDATDSPDAELNGQPNGSATGDDLDGNDDEDGLIIPNLTPGQAANFNLEVNDGAGFGGVVEIWIDYDQSGTWEHPAEQVYSGWLPVGINAININVPAGAVPGTTFARARISSAGGLTPTGGPADDGEVEDTRVTIEEPPPELDFGDAPDPTYPTLLASNGARHIIAGPWIGDITDSPDAELNGQPNASATGDDNDGNDDEDGLILPVLIPGQAANFNLEVNGAGGIVQIWIDYNQNGNWEHPAEQAYSNFLAVGIHPININVPAGAIPGTTFVRARISTAGGLTPVGQANDGEVEDTETFIEEPPPDLDFGDAPDPAYPTLLASNGARHIIGGPWIGDATDSPDAELNGQPNATATGDDNDGNDDEDGLIIPVLTPGFATSFNLEVNDGAGAGGFVDIWIDYNQNGSWEPAEQVYSGFLPVGIHMININVPLGAIPGTTFARARISSAGGLRPEGLADDGEVEDVEVYIEEPPELDFGDAPDPTYPTLLASNGARHIIAGPWMGDITDSPDSEANGQPNAAATGDDNDGNDDEDGLILPVLIPGQPANFNLEVNGAGGVVQIWIDYNQNGSWEHPAEQVYSNFLAVGIHPININVPAGTPLGTTFARARISSAGGLTPKGLAEDGEVEDTEVVIAIIIEPKPLIEHSKWSQPPIEIDPASRIPVYFGWDEISLRELWEPPESWDIVADDFRCLGDMPITSIHWFGSYYGWGLPGGVPPQLPIGWKICFWSNVPADPTADPNYSHPEVLLWQIEVDADRVEIEEVGSDYYPDYFLQDTCYQYTLHLEPNEYFQQGDFETRTIDNVFWISIAALYELGPYPDYPWGWKTRPWHWMDDATRFQVFEPLEPGLVLDPYNNNMDPIEDPLYQESVDLAFELDTDPNYIKWEQHYTGLRHWPHYEDEVSMGQVIGWSEIETKWLQEPDLTPEGMDVDATMELTAAPIWPPQILADDFLCKETGAITEISIWGSWLYDEMPMMNPTAVDFILSIYSDNPVGPSGWSEPNEVLWTTYIPAAAFMVEPVYEGPEGYFNPCDPFYDPANHQMAWKYTFSIDPQAAFTQEGDPCEPVVYWLAVQARPLPETSTRFGWKTSMMHWNDDAVFTIGEGGQPFELWTELRHPVTAESLDLAFEIKTEKQYEEIDIARQVADDWLCEKETPVTAAVWWGSYLGYGYEPLAERFMPLPVKPDFFLLTLWDDVPDPDPCDPLTFSHPNDAIWQYSAYDYDEVLVGYDKNPHGAPNEPVFRYSVRLPKQNWFMQEDVNNIYWLSVVAVYDDNTPNYDWGWTNHQHYYNDDAAAWEMDPAGGTWSWVPLKDQTGETEDMSFILFTNDECFPWTYSTYNDWVTLGKPDCWCSAYQCDGDADGGTSGYQKYRIYGPDFTILVANWQKKIADPTLDPCADFDHKPSGYQKYRVYGPDFTILVNNWMKKDAALPGDCPRPE